MACSATIIPNEYTLHWRPQANGVNITAVASGKGFVGLGWTADLGQMIGSHAIIGWVNDNGSQNVSLLHLFPGSMCQTAALMETTAFIRRTCIMWFVTLQSIACRDQ